MKFPGALANVHAADQKPSSVSGELPTCLSINVKSEFWVGIL